MWVRPTSLMEILAVEHPSSAAPAPDLREICRLLSGYPRASRLASSPATRSRSASAANGLRTNAVSASRPAASGERLVAGRAQREQRELGPIPAQRVEEGLPVRPREADVDHRGIDLV